ncbi:MAG: type II secretion system F family protein, partial [Cellvibrionaceae bacterium]|nr:type II secretion system F family protein [Cellvibrionaceae bacterium]
DLFISLVKVGESTGKLEQVFFQLSVYLERDVQTKKSVKTAIRYPLFVVVAMVVAMLVVNLWVIPAFVDLFNQFSADLPGLTRLLMSTSYIVVHYSWLLVLVLVATYAVCIYGLGTPGGKKIWGRITLKLPIVGGLIYKAAMARYVRSFALMLAAGVPLVKAIGLCADVVDNAYLSEKIKTIKSGIERGDGLHRTHSRSGLFTPLILQMINIGEQSGEMDRLLSDVADFYDGEVDYELKSLSAKIEPLLIVLMACFVLLLALGIFLPMWEMYSIQS